MLPEYGDRFLYKKEIFGVMDLYDFHRTRLCPFSAISGCDVDAPDTRHSTWGNGDGTVNARRVNCRERSGNGMAGGIDEGDGSSAAGLEVVPADSEGCRSVAVDRGRGK